jgi:hypothetical protein
LQNLQKLENYGKMLIIASPGETNTQIRASSPKGLPAIANGELPMVDKGKEGLLQGQVDALDAERLNVKDQLDRERLRRVTSDVIDTITSPEFVEKMRLARISADEGGGLDAASKLLSLDGLRGAGVDIPKDFRLTSRVFEDRAAGFNLELNSGQLGGRALPSALVRARPDWGACAGAGGFGHCGCAGFRID